MDVPGVGQFPLPEPTKALDEPSLTRTPNQARVRGFFEGARQGAKRVLTPEVLGGVSALAAPETGGLSLAIPPVVGAATSAIRDLTGMNGEQSPTDMAGRALLHGGVNALPGIVGGLSRARGAAGPMADAVTGAIASGGGVPGRAMGALRGVFSGGSAAAPTAAGGLGDLATATLPGGIKLVSPDGLTALVQKSVDLTNAAGAGRPAEAATIQALDALIAQVRGALRAAPTGSALLSKVGLPSTSAVATRAGRITNTLRGLLGAGSVAREGSQ